jgi:uncharacterized protein YegP (UPF0339 family)
VGASLFAKRPAQATEGYGWSLLIGEKPLNRQGATSMSGWYEVSKSSNGQFRFVLKAANAETILTSELYTTRAAADGGIASVQTNSPLDERYEKKTTKDGHPYFNLKAANHQIIGSSESYSSDSACDKGIASVKTNGPTKVIKDKTLRVL